MISFYFDWSRFVFSRESHHDESHHSSAVENGSRKAKKVNQRPNVARDHHQDPENALYV